MYPFNISETDTDKIMKIYNRVLNKYILFFLGIIPHKYIPFFFRAIVYIKKSILINARGEYFPSNLFPFRIILQKYIYHVRCLGLTT